MNINEVEILLVEDNADDAEMTIRALKKLHLANNLVHVEDGQEALDFLFGTGKYAERETANIPKVVLLDIKMPKVDGIEVLKQIKTHPSTRKIPVVIMTSSSEEKDMIASYDFNANSYVVKPVHFENFARAVSELGLYWLVVNRTPGRGDNMQ